MKHYKNMQAFLKDYEAATKGGHLESIETCYRKLLDQLFSEGSLWPRYRVWKFYENSSCFAIDIGCSENYDVTESFQILPEPDAPEPRLAITTPSMDVLIQRWPKSQYQGHVQSYRCTRVVTSFADLKKALKSWVKYRACMLELQAKELRGLEAKNDRDLKIFQNLM